MIQIRCTLTACILAACVTFSSCLAINYGDEVIPAGQTTAVTGQVYDINLQKPEVSCSVYVFENTLDDVNKVDSTLTDSLGNYRIEFVTTGNGFNYWLEIQPSHKLFWKENMYATEIAPATDNTININIAKLAVLQSKIRVVENPYPKLTCMSEYSDIRFNIQGNDADTVLLLPILPNADNVISFYHLMYDSVPPYIIQRNDTINLAHDFTDTVETEFELRPATFEGRTYSRW